MRTARVAVGHRCFVWKTNFLPQLLPTTRGDKTSVSPRVVEGSWGGEVKVERGRGVVDREIGRWRCSTEQGYYAGERGRSGCGTPKTRKHGLMFSGLSNPAFREPQAFGGSVVAIVSETESR